MNDAALWIAPTILAGLFLAAMEAAPPLVFAAAIAPAVAYAVLVVLLTGPREPLPLLVALFLWGAVAAAVAAEPLNAMLGTRALGPVLWGPLVEETVKALGLVALVCFGRERPRDVRSGIACGALVGLGFAAAENLEVHLLAALQGGPAGLARAFFVRGVVQGLNHATFTAATGAGLALARTARGGAARALALPLGFAAGVIQHAAWNAVASYAITDLLCGAPTAADACLAAPSSEALFLRIPLLVAIFIAPGLVALVLLARASSKPLLQDGLRRG